MNKELETIIENEFDCLINDLGCLIGEEWKAEAVKKAVNQAFVLGGVINWVACKNELPKENQKEYKKAKKIVKAYKKQLLIHDVVCSKLCYCEKK
jgi:thiamine monophosphate synthase